MVMIKDIPFIVIVASVIVLALLVLANLIWLIDSVF